MPRTSRNYHRIRRTSHTRKNSNTQYTNTSNPHYYVYRADHFLQAHAPIMTQLKEYRPINSSSVVIEKCARVLASSVYSNNIRTIDGICAHCPRPLRIEVDTILTQCNHHKTRTQRTRYPPRNRIKKHGGSRARVSNKLCACDTHNAIETRFYINPIISLCQLLRKCARRREPISIFRSVCCCSLQAEEVKSVPRLARLMRIVRHSAAYE